MTTSSGAIPTLAEASQQLAERTCSASELVQGCLDRIAQREADLQTFITLTADDALAAARRADAEIESSGPRTPLHGIPYALKDIVETKGLRTTAHSRTLADYVPAQSAEVAQRLAAAGGILLGKTATWEFAHGGPSWDILQPPAHNPWRLSHDPAGSSSGSAAGIAAGFFLGTVGSDTGGSIRGPAAACGITGLKPTYGRVSRRGVIANSYTHDHVGPMAWTAADVAMLLQSMAGHDPLDDACADVPVPDFSAHLMRNLDGLRIGVPYAWIDEEVPASPDVREAFGAALKVLETLGAQVRKITLPPVQAFEDAKKVIAAVELFSIHADAIRHTPELLGEDFRVRVMGGALIRGEQYMNAHRARKGLAAAVHHVMRDVDVILLPSTTHSAGKLVPRPAETLFTKLGYLTAFNVSGNPALSTRMGMSPDGLPLSLQIVGKLFDEETVLNVAHRYEKATDWVNHRPTFLP